MAAKNTATKKKKRRTHPLYPGARPTWEIAYLFPGQGRWTEEAYLSLDDGLREGTHPLLELANGHLEVLSMPTHKHQLIVFFLLKALDLFVLAHAPGIISFSGMKVRLGKRKFREPDVLYMMAANQHRCNEKYWEGADLVMEVVSPGRNDRKRDLEVKPAAYAQAGIPEYWIVNPIDGWIRVLVLKGKSYQLHGEFRPGAVATSVLLPGFQVSVEAALNPPGSSSAK